MTATHPGGEPRVSEQLIDDPADVRKVAAAEAPGEQEASAEQPARIRGFGFWALVKRHKAFSLVFALGFALRVITMIGYYPAMWFNDSFDYLHAALAFYPHPIRPDGYSFLLVALEPFHSFALVAGLQHLMGLGIALMVYALLRRRLAGGEPGEHRGLPGWGAALAATPVLLDAYQIQLEQLILSDVMFEFLIMAVVTMLVWKRPTMRTAAIAGLLLGIATLTRSVGTPVLIAVLAYMVVTRTHWKKIAATLALCALPLSAYAGWYYSWHGKFGLTGTSGIFLYARASAFADCTKMKDVPTSEIPLCPENLKEQKNLVFSQDVIWATHSPLIKYGPNKFSPQLNQLAGDFAKRAIMDQPVDYSKTVAGDFFRAFAWKRTVFPDRATYELYQFNSKPRPLPTWSMGNGKTAAQEADQYEQGNAEGQVNEPFAGVMRWYMKYFYLRGTFVGLILLIGLAAVVQRFRRRSQRAESLFGWGWGGPALLPWIVATGLLLVPAATAEFDYRYVLPIVPIGCLAAGMAFSRVRRSADAVRERS
jgi:hypothetical protein